MVGWAGLGRDMMEVGMARPGRDLSSGRLTGRARSRPTTVEFDGPGRAVVRYTRN